MSPEFTADRIADIRTSDGFALVEVAARERLHYVFGEFVCDIDVLIVRKENPSGWSVYEYVDGYDSSALDIATTPLDPKFLFKKPSIAKSFVDVVCVSKQKDEPLAGHVLDLDDATIVRHMGLQPIRLDSLVGRVRYSHASHLTRAQLFTRLSNMARHSSARVVRRDALTWQANPESPC